MHPAHSPWILQLIKSDFDKPINGKDSPVVVAMQRIFKDSNVAIKRTDVTVQTKDRGTKEFFFDAAYWNTEVYNSLRKKNNKNIIDQNTVVYELIIGCI